MKRKCLGLLVFCNVKMYINIIKKYYFTLVRIVVIKKIRKVIDEDEDTEKEEVLYIIVENVNYEIIIEVVLKSKNDLVILSKR